MFGRNDGVWTHPEVKDPSEVARGGAVGGWGGSVMWFSPDGFSWSRFSLPRNVFGEATSLLEAEVAAWGPGLIMLGGEHKDVAIWIATPSDP